MSFLKLLINFDISPFIPFILNFLALSVEELIKSPTASASTKSILPFKKALFINSPGSACLTSSNNKISIILFVAVTPP